MGQVCVPMQISWQCMCVCVCVVCLSKPPTAVICILQTAPPSGLWEPWTYRLSTAILRYTVVIILSANPPIHANNYPVQTSAAPVPQLQGVLNSKIILVFFSFPLFFPAISPQWDITLITAVNRNSVSITACHLLCLGSCLQNFSPEWRAGVLCRCVIIFTYCFSAYLLCAEF